jgi:hypothetical protein
MSRRGGRSIGLILLALGPGGCGGRALPDPEPVALRYADALRRGDDAAVYQLLSAQAQREIGQQRLHRLLLELKPELQAQAKAIRDPRARIEVQAQVRFIDGELATFGVEDGALKLHSVVALPARATTPQQALSDLRSALARRSYPALQSVLTRDSAGAFDEKMNSLVEALEDPESLLIQVEAGRAVVELPDGHRVELRKEEGLWKVRDFE